MKVYEGVTQAIPIECFTYTYLYVSRPLLGKEFTSYRYGLMANIVARYKVGKAKERAAYPSYSP